MSDESSLLTEEYLLKDRELLEVFKAIRESGIFCGEYVIGSGCLVLVSKVNSEFIAEPILYNVSLKVEWEEIRNYEKTYAKAKAKPTARLMLAGLEIRNHPKGFLSYRVKLVFWRVIDHAKPLAKQEVSNRADVDERMEALEMYEPYGPISERPLKNLVPSPKGWSYFSKRPFVALWDLENCNIPAKGAKVSPEEAVNNIKAYVKCKFGIDEKNIRIFAYANFSEMRKVKKGLKNTNVVPVDTGKIKHNKDVADKLLIYNLGIHAITYLEPYSIMLISGDVDYVNPLRDLHDKWGHNIVLAIPSGSWVWFALTDASDSLLYWPNVVRGEDQPTLSLEIRKGKMLLLEEKPSKKLLEKKPSDKLVEEKPSVKLVEIPNVQVSVKSQLLSLNDVIPIVSGDLTDVVRGDQLTLSLQNKKGKMLLVGENPSDKLVEEKSSEKLMEERPSEKLMEEREEIPNVQFSVESQPQLFPLNDATPVQPGGLTDVVRGEDQPTSSLQIKKGKMPLVEAKPSGKLVEEKPCVKFSVESQLQLLSLNDVTPIQSVDLTGLKAELVKFLETSSGKPLDLTRLKGGLVEFLGDSSGNRTLLALLRNIGKS